METCEYYDIGCYFDYVFEEIELFFVWVYSEILGGVVSLFDSIPVPDFLQNIDTYTLPDSVAFYASAFEIDTGIGIIVAAFSIRFIIRRLPIFG